MSGPARPRTVALVGVLRAIRRWHAPLAYFALVMLVLSGVSVVGYVLDDRVITGAPAWAKPLKFALSFALYAVTLAWMITQIARPNWRRTAWWAGTVVAAASLLEVGAITLQVVRGTTSHYNNSTPFDASVFVTMGVLVTVLYACTLLIGIALLRSPLTDAVMAWALRLGVAIGLAGLAVGFLMLAPGAHSVGVPDGGPGLPFVGWSTTGGDLRIGHFIGMHALQVIPLLALVLGLPAMRARLGDRARLQLVLLAAGAYAGVVALTVWQALRGQPLLSPDALTLVAAGVLVALTTGAAAAILAGGRSDGRTRTGSDEDHDTSPAPVA